MNWIGQYIVLIVVLLFGLLLRYVAFTDFIICFACKEMDSMDKEYDYIVVGSGSAGSIVARRLAEQKDVTVLVLEAGSTGSWLLDIPALTPLMQKSVFDWQYQTVPQEHSCLGLSSQVSNWPMGKIVGGTSTLNNMVYVRGHPQDFANWYAEKEDYSFDTDILPYFKKLENFVKDSVDDPSKSVSISDLPFATSISSRVLEGARSLGYNVVSNGAINCEEGFTVPKVTMRSGMRRTPSHRLQNPKKPNLVLRTNTLIEKVLLKDNFEAYGVKYSYLNEHYYAKASRGVILSAGVIGSPKILMLSGIGPEAHLRELRINPKINLPVGDNLHDHVCTGLDLVLLNTTTGAGVEDMLSPKTWYDYFIKATGPMAGSGCDNVAFIKTSNNTKAPDVQFMVLPIGVSVDGGVHLYTLPGISDHLLRNYFTLIKQTAITILPITTNPKSRGNMRLKSRNALTPPLIDPKYLSERDDVDTVVRGIKIIKQLVKTESMQRLGAQINPLVLPGCEGFKFDSDPYWECYVRHLTITSYHPVGTCEMGKVVDFDFQIKYTNKLYVVDGSVLPTITTGNPNGAIMMLAEKAADTIKYHRYLSENRCAKKELLLPKTMC